MGTACPTCPNRQAGCTQPRGVAQFGSALRLGRKGRRFKSCHPDHQVHPGVKIGQGRPIPLLAPQQSMRPEPPMTLARGPIPLMVSHLPNRMHLAEQPGDVNPERGQDPDIPLRVLSARHHPSGLTNCMQSATLVTPGPVAQSAEHGDF